MNRSDYAFHPLSWEQYQAIIQHGSFPNVPEPMLNRPDYDSLLAVLQPANIDPRLGLAFTWAEGHDGTDPGLVAASVNNLGGIKYSGAPGTYDSGIPADTGGTYAGFPDLTAYWREWVRIMNNSIIGPSFKSGNLVSAVEHYTNGPGTGHNKVDQFLAYARDYPAGGNVMNGVYGEDVIAKARQYIGQATSDGTLDSWNGSHPWAFWCEAFTEGIPASLGLVTTHYESAAGHLDAITAAGLLQQGTPEHGAWCLFGRTFDPNGHICFWDSGKQQYLGTLTDGTGIGYHDQSWTASLAGWCRVPGVLAPYRSTSSSDTFFVDGNPHGQIPMKVPFWNRWHYMDTLGLALPMIGYPVAAEVTVGGRRVQQCERGWLGTQDAADPWNVVMLLRDEWPT
jgi:hypothetical protein